jgi:hypothetical protein
MTGEPESVAVLAAQVAGLLDLTKAQGDSLQRTLDEIKSTMREDRQAAEKRLKDHIEAPNPHPAQEQWLRDQHNRHDDRIKQIETSLASDHGYQRAIRWLLGIALTEGLTVVGLVLQVTRHR